MSIKVYVEGGGDSDLLKRQCRGGFKEFFEKAGLKGRLPKVIPCGSREKRMTDFVPPLMTQKPAVLSFSWWTVRPQSQPTIALGNT